MFFSPLRHGKEFFSSAMRFGYSTIRFGLDLAIIYAGYYLITAPFKGCNREKPETKIEASLEKKVDNSISFYTNSDKTVKYVDRL